MKENKLKLHDSILEIFPGLSHKDSDIRINASYKILHLLEKKQSEVPEDTTCLDLAYSVKRLVKGLASTREFSRIGFSLLLTEILKKFPVVLVEDVVDLISKHLAFISKQEKKDIIFGRLFAYSSLVLSGRLATHSHLSFIVSSLYELWQGRSYILNASYETLCQLFLQISSDVFKEQIWSYFKSNLSGGWENCSLDTFWLLLLCTRVFPDAISEKYLKKHWGGTDLLAEENHNNIKKLLRQSSNSLPNLHPSCMEVLAHIKTRKDRKDLWISLVDDNLFEGDQIEKAYVGFEMVKYALQQSQKRKQIKYVFSPKFLAMFTKCYLYSKHPMYPAALHLAGFLADFTKSTTDPETQILVLKTLIQPPNSVLENQLMQKSEVSSIIQNLLPDAVKIFYGILKAVAVKKKKHEEEVVENISAKRIQAIVQITSLISHPATFTDYSWRVDVTKFLFLHSFFTVTSPTSDILHCKEMPDEIPTSINEQFKLSFYKALSSLNHRTENKSQHFQEYLVPLTEYAEQLMLATENVEPKFTLEMIQKPWSKLKSSIRKLAKHNTKSKTLSEARMFEVLLLELGFYMFHDPDSIADVLEELHVCCKKAVNADKRKSELVTDDDEPPWINVMVDILLSLLSKSAANLRQRVVSAFTSLCPYITQDALKQILDVINSENPDDGPTLVTESDAEDEEMEFDSGSSSEDKSDSDVDNSEVDEEFEDRVKTALGPAADDSETESVIFSDTEMFKLDDALSKAFQSRRQGGKFEKNSEEKVLLNFKLRCLDLIQAYLKSEPPLHLALQCIEPLLAAREQKHLSKDGSTMFNKCISTLQMLSKIRKFQNVESMDKSELNRLLQLLIQKCDKEVDLSLARNFYDICVFLVLTARKLENLKEPKKSSSKSPFYIKLYLSALETFVSSSSSHLIPQFFVGLMKACPDLAWHFLEPCQKHALSKSIRPFKKTQCLGLIYEILKFSKKQESVSDAEWTELGKSLLPLLVEDVKDAIEASNVKSAHIIEMLDIINLVHSILESKTNESALRNFPNLLPVLISMDKGLIKKLASKGKMARRNIIQALGGDVNGHISADITVDESATEQEKPLKPKSEKLKAEKTQIKTKTKSGKVKDGEISPIVKKHTEQNRNDSVASSEATNEGSPKKRKKLNKNKKNKKRKKSISDDQKLL